MNEEKVQFLKHRFIPLLQQIPSNTSPRWGKMTVQQMIEHFADSVAIASGNTVHTDIVTPEAHLEKYRDFLRSEKSFRENTINPLMPETPAPVRDHSVSDALEELQSALNYFFSAFEKSPLLVTRNPIFGDLNYEENVQLLYKHALHHLKQFGVTIQSETQV